MRNKHIQLTVFLAVLLIIATACGPDAPNNSNNGNDNQVEQETPQEVENTQEVEETQQVEDTPEPLPSETPTLVEEQADIPEFFEHLATGAVTVDKIFANSQDEDTFGPILTLMLTNPGTEEILVTVPCGLVFTPSDDQNQRMMMLQPLELTLAPGEIQSVNPYVVCIDVTASAPGFNNTYYVGTLTDHPSLLKFAECICDQELSSELGSMDGVGVQFAAWNISIGGDFSNITDGAGAMGDFLEEGFGDVTGEGFEQVMQMMSTFGDEWLEGCEIEIEE